jgi:hypothetical protein
LVAQRGGPKFDRRGRAPSQKAEQRQMTVLAERVSYL